MNEGSGAGDPGGAGTCQRLAIGNPDLEEPWADREQGVGEGESTKALPQDGGCGFKRKSLR